MKRAGLTAPFFLSFLIAAFLVTPQLSVASEVPPPGVTPTAMLVAPTAATPPPPPPALLSGVGYYVTQFGAGAHDGSFGNEWSVAEYNSSSRPTAGDTVYFSGTITSTVRVATSGLSGSRLTLDMRGATLSTADPRINLNGRNHVNIYGGTFAPSSGGTLVSSNETPADNVTVSGWNYTGEANAVTVFAFVPQVSNFVLEDNTVDNVKNFIVAYRSNTHHLTIRNNYGRSSANTTSQTDNVFIADADSVTIEGNKFILRAPGNYVERHNDVIQSFQSRATPNAAPSNWIIRYNWIEMNVPSGDGSVSWFMAEDLDQSVKLYGNVFFAQDSTATLGLNFLFSRTGLVVSFHNNTVVRKGGDPGSLIRFFAPGTAHIRNNIVMSDTYTTGTMLTWEMIEGSDWDRNFIYNGYGCNAVITGPNGSCVTNPQIRDFANQDFSLAATSPLIGAGDNTIGAEYSAGIIPGATWPNPALADRGLSWDAGAFIYGGVIAATPPPPPPTEEVSPPAEEPPPPTEEVSPPAEEPPPPTEEVSPSTEEPPPPTEEAPPPTETAPPPPSITSISLASSGSTAATISWQTDGVYTWMEYGSTGEPRQFGQVDTWADGVYSIHLTGLAMNTTYTYRISAMDSFGSIAISEESAFTTGFSISDLTAVSSSTDGGARFIGYASAAVTGGGFPSGLAILTRRQGDVLVDEVATPATTLMTSGRTLLEVSADGLLNTAISIANPQMQDVTVNFELRTNNGIPYQSGSFTLTGTPQACDPEGICSQLSVFADEYPFSSGRGIQGTLSFTSTAPISIDAYRVLINERTPRDVLSSHQPVTDLTMSADSGVQVIPHVVLGNGVKTDVALINPTGRYVRGALKFLDPSGAPMIVNHAGAYVDSVDYSLMPNGSDRIEIGDASGWGQMGSIWVVPSNSDPTPTAFAVFSFKPGAYTVSEGITPVTMGTAFRLFAEVEPSERLSTTVAVANASPMTGLITFSLTDLQGILIGSETRELAPSSRLVHSIASLFPSLAWTPVQGILRITTNLPSIAVAGFRERFNTRQPEADYLFTGITPLRETGDPLPATVFSQIVTGDGLTTQIILYSGTSGQTSEGSLMFVRPDGTPVLLDLR